MRRSLRAITQAAAVGLLVATSASAVFASTPVQNGCPASAQLTSVAALEASGPYQLPARLDDPANGGNGDGWICAFPLPDAMSTAQGVNFTIYQFFENNLPAEGRP
jgi:hypothetical protein